MKLELEIEAIAEMKGRLQYLQSICMTKGVNARIGDENDQRKKRNRPVINELLRTLKKYEL